MKIKELCGMICEQSPWLFSDPSNWQTVIDRLKINPLSLEKGTIIYHQGSINKKVYVIKSGRVNLSVVDKQGDEKCLFVLGSGCVFGEVAVLSGRATSSSAIAVSPVVLYEVPGEYVLEMLKININLNRVIIDNLLKKVNLLTNQIELLSFYDSSYRVSENIYYLMDHFGKPDKNGGVLIAMKFTHQEMAKLVGVTRVTVTNIFLKLEREGLIEKRKNGIYIKDPERFKDYIKAKRSAL